MSNKGSRRAFLRAGTGLLAAGAALARALPERAAAQSAEADVERLLRQRRILLRGGIVLTLDRSVGDFARADLLIEDGKIREVRPAIALSDADAAVIDASSHIVIPGFVDTHSHSYEGLLRSSLPAGTLFDPTYERDFANLTRAYQPADVHAGVLVTALGMIDMGTTAVVDTSQISHTPEHSDALLAGFKDAGIRAVLAYSPGAGASAQYPQDVLRLRRSYFSSPDQLLTLALGVSRDPKLFAYARENGLRAVMHIRLESDAILALGRAGLMRPGDEYIHCAHLSDAAWRTIKDTGGRTSHSPPLEMAMGHGMPSIQDALDHGLRPSLSSDHTKTVAQDMFGMMRTLFELQRLAILQRRQAGEQSLPALLSPRDVLEFATIEGARCAALDHRCGTLSPGKDADILLLRADRLDVWPHSNAFGTVASLMNPSHVDTVFIAGKLKKWRGSLVGVDTARVLQLVEDSRAAVMRRANFRVELLG
jgi:5-methylthioadenosine/S-adenosylhomocysteine deaminase